MNALRLPPGVMTRSGILASVTLTLFLVAGSGGREASAHDVSAVHSGTEVREGRVGPFAGVSEQFSRSTTLQRDGEEVDNEANERLESSITQLVAGYGVTPKLSVQANVPLIHRSFRRVVGEAIDRGNETGIGDVSLLGRFAVWSRVTEESLVRLSLLGGVELPTGDSDRLAEELEENHHQDGEEVEPHEHGDESGVHGHDLALGSGSWDGLFGAQLFASSGRAFFGGNVQYAVRTEGDFDYDHANELTWSGGPGWLLVLRHDCVLGLQAVFSGQSKGEDRLRGEDLDDTAITSLYAGPGLLFTWSSSLGTDVAADLPVVQNNSALQIIADFRLRGGLTWRF
ncbi:MAG: hypothetical protein ACREQY_14785 [Candidatus Binatia bacterium]